MIKKIYQERKTYFFLILTLAAFLIFYQLGANYLVSFDEAWYAEVSRQMLESKNLLKMTWNRQPFFDKPPLFFWLQVLSFEILGLSEFAARFFPALTGLGVIYLTFLIGSKLSLATGVFSSLVLLSFPLFINQARFANLEMMVSFFIILAIFYLLRLQESPKKNTLFFLATSLAIFTKGIVGFIPLLLLLSLIIFARKKQPYQNKDYLKGILLILLINLPWYLLVNLLFKEKQLLLPAFNLERFRQINPATGIDFFYYLKILKTGLKLWIIPLPFAILFSLYKFLKEKDKRIFIILSWVFITYVSFSIPYLKNSWYITSIYPSLALILGFFIGQLCKKKFFNLGVITALFMLLTHFLSFRHQFWPPETVAAEVKLLKIIKKQTSKNDFLYLDDNYHPLAVFYSERLVIPIRFTRGSFNTLESENLKLNKKTFFLSNEENIEELKLDLKSYRIKTEKIIGDKILLSVSP